MKHKKIKPKCDYSSLQQVLLVGNPNTGKTTLFNKLTRSNEHVGNWHGVTVEEKSQPFLCGDEKMLLVDLPGIYSLSALSYEEQVAINYIRSHPKTKIINICDENNLQRNLSLTLGLIEFGADVVLAINCMDKRPLNRVDAAMLSKKLGISVVKINAEKGDGFDKLFNAIKQPYSPAPMPEYVKGLGTKKYKQLFLQSEKTDFFAIKLLERDEEIAQEFSINLDEIDLPRDSIELVATARYGFITSLQHSCVTSTGKTYGKSILDKIFLNRFLAFPIFLLVLCGIFYLTFFSLGAWLSDLLNKLLDISLARWTESICVSLFGEASWVTHLFCDAIIGGVGTVLSFLPQVALLFLFLSLLEDSGYLSRVAFASEDIFGKLGLSGKSIYTLLMGFGCSTSAVLTARNMEDKNSKIKTALLTPYMSCSAKFPIYVVIGGAFFGASNVFVILGLYLLGLAVSLVLSLILEKTMLKSKQQSFILEFPPYRFGGAKRLAKVLWDNVKTFLLRVGSLLVSMNVIVWILSNFSFDFSFTPTSGKMSMLEGFGKILAPIFVPLGFGNWGAASALVAGVIAKEIIVSSIAMFNCVGTDGDIGASLKNPASMIYFPSAAAAISYLVFSLLYLPCISTIAVLSKEIGKKWTVAGCVIQFAIGYLCALFVYHVWGACETFGIGATLGVLAAAIVIVCAIIKVASVIKSKKKCKNCQKCN